MPVHNVELLVRHRFAQWHSGRFPLAEVIAVHHKRAATHRLGGTIVIHHFAGPVLADLLQQFPGKFLAANDYVLSRQDWSASGPVQQCV